MLVFIRFVALVVLAWYAARGTSPNSRVLVYFAVFVLALDRNYFLPFLGPSVFPPVFTPTIPEGAETSVAVVANGPVVYWAADVDAGDPRTAYDGYSNSGVAIPDEGVAKLRVRPPGVYNVAGGVVTLPPHVHYREYLGNGMWSPVMTVHSLTPV